ncbi:MAG: phosphoenolpyruvate--protein phosphotransferase [Gemmatimonadaceae bacterium]|nr:phosphoenolpyruvate--protein phosphotransferase [Gemmatimonadaceae bacterium]
MSSQTLTGIPASPGIVAGPVHLLRWEVPEVSPRTIDEEMVEGEIARLHAALGIAQAKLRQVRDRAERNAGAEEAAIFDVQMEICSDPDLKSSIEHLIRQHFAAEKAVDLVLLEWRQLFARSTNALMRERTSDLTDVQIRLLSVLLGLPDHDPVDLPKGANAIVVTHDLTPSLTVQLDRDAIAAIATDAGTRTSHVAILARSLGLPAVVGLLDAVTRLQAGDTVILDGTAGTLVVRPTSHELAEAQQRQRREQRSRAALAHFAQEAAVTADGVALTVRANVDLPDEAEHAAASGADGVGLMRTEFLVVGRATMPDEDEQVAAYVNVIEAFGGRPVVIRTFDVGGDKLPMGGFPHEANPFLGWRAIRMCLDEPEMFKTQLRALLRAALTGDVRIMLPLVVSVDEVRAARRLMDEAKQELTARGIAFRHDVPLGVMVETPAAALSVEALAPECAFFSIGTNDLVQYTLAVDRGNARLATRFTPLHPAVLGLIARTQAEGAKHGLEVCVCGEMASEPLMAFALIGLGIRQLSVSPIAIASVKRIITGIDASGAASAARAALAAGTAERAEALLAEALRAQLRAHGMDDLGV